MTDLGLINFGACAVDVPARTVLRGGLPQAFEPKVFDALVYLIEHRDRVVPKQELLHHVWGERVVVTEGVIARTIMKLRRLLGDDADEPVLVKTVHRIGYRFAGEVAHDAAPSDDGAARKFAQRAMRVAVLPVVNRTGSAALSWVDLGLMTAASQALHDGGIAVAEAADVLAAVGGADGPVDAAAALASDVVQATLDKRGDGTLTLAWRGYGRALERAAGEVSGSEPIEMCRRMASELLLRLGRGYATAAPHDPYLQAVRTRARQAIEGERWESARRLLQVALDGAPDNPLLHLDQARCLVQLRDMQALPLLERLQRHASRNADAALERRCLRLLARCKQHAGDVEEAERLLSRALALAEADHDRDVELELLQAMAELAAARGRGAIADWLLDRAAALAQTLGDHAAIAHALDTRGRIAAACGDRDAAIRHFEDALQLQHAAGVHAGAAHTLIHVGDMQLAFGRIGSARQCFAAAFDKALTSGDPAAIAIGGIDVGRHAGTEIGRDDVARAVVARMRAVDSPGRIVIGTFADLLDAVVQARAGRLADCLELLDRAEAGYARRNFQVHVRRIRTAVLAASGFVDEARDTVGEFLADAPSGLRSLIAAIGQHMLGICEHAAGDAAAALRHLDAAAASAPHSLWRLHMLFDAAWLRLEGGDSAAAACTLDGCRAEFDAALADDHGPALVLRAMLHEASGEADAAAALRGRCPLPPGAACTWGTRPRHARWLPSQVSIAPSLDGTRQGRRAAA